MRIALSGTAGFIPYSIGEYARPNGADSYSQTGYRSPVKAQALDMLGVEYASGTGAKIAVNVQGKSSNPCL